MQICRYDIAQTAQVFTIERAFQFSLLNCQLTICALIQRCDRFSKYLGFLAHPIGAVGFGIKGIQQRTEAFIAAREHTATVLQNRAVGEVGRPFSLAQQHRRLKRFGKGQLFGKIFCKRCFIQRHDIRVGFAAEAERKLSRNQR